MGSEYGRVIYKPKGGWGVQELKESAKVVNITGHEVSPKAPKRALFSPFPRGLFLSLLIILKWVGAFCVYPFFMLCASVVLSIYGMLQMPVLMIKELIRPS